MKKIDKSNLKCQQFITNKSLITKRNPFLSFFLFLRHYPFFPKHPIGTIVVDCRSQGVKIESLNDKIRSVARNSIEKEVFHSVTNGWIRTKRLLYKARERENLDEQYHCLMIKRRGAYSSK